MQSGVYTETPRTGIHYMDVEQIEDTSAIKVWGYHAAYDCAGCAIDKITDGENIKAFSKALVEAIDMKAYGEPQAVHFAAHDPNKGGYTLVQLIETSNICAHFVDATGEAYIDIFSCKEFSPDDGLGVIIEFFDPKNVGLRTMTRGVPA